jgi:predicted nucleic acid-binding Zn ribbon protein
MYTQIECPTCGSVRNLTAAASDGARTFCRQCGARLEIRLEQPMEVVRIPLQAEDFGI